MAIELVEIDRDPFAEVDTPSEKDQYVYKPVDYDPFSEDERKVYTDTTEHELKKIQARHEVPQPKASAARYLGALWEGTKEVFRQSVKGIGLAAERSAEKYEEHMGKEMRQHALRYGLDKAKPGEDIDRGEVAPSPLATSQKELAAGLQGAAEAKWLKPDPEYYSSSGMIEDIIRVGPQVVSQMAISVPTAGVGSTMLMGAQIIGSTYEQEKAKGVDDDTAIAAGIANAVMQAPLEQLGISGVTKFWRTRGAIVNKLKSYGEMLGREWLTEFFQQFPDAAVEIWARDPNEATLAKVKEFVDRLPDTMLQGAKEGLTVVPWAFIGGAVGHKATQMKWEADLRNKGLTASDIDELKRNPLMNPEDFISQKSPAKVADDQVTAQAQSVVEEDKRTLVPKANETTDEKSAAQDLFSALRQQDPSSDKPTPKTPGEIGKHGTTETTVEEAHDEEVKRNRIRLAQFQRQQQMQYEMEDRAAEEAARTESRQAEKQKVDAMATDVIARMEHQRLMDDAATPFGLMDRTSKFIMQSETSDDPILNDITKSMRNLHKELAVGSGNADKLKSLVYDLEQAAQGIMDPTINVLTDGLTKYAGAQVAGIQYAEKAEKLTAEAERQQRAAGREKQKERGAERQVAEEERKRPKQVVEPMAGVHAQIEEDVRTKRREEEERAASRVEMLKKYKQPTEEEAQVETQKETAASRAAREAEAEKQSERLRLRQEIEKARQEQAKQVGQMKVPTEEESRYAQSITRQVGKTVPEEGVEGRGVGQRSLRYARKYQEGEEAQKEKIAAAAIRTPEGKVYTGVSHGYAYLDNPELQKAYRDDESLERLDLGFVTNTGKFVSREQAAKLEQVSRSYAVSEDFENRPGWGMTERDKHAEIVESLATSTRRLANVPPIEIVKAEENLSKERRDLIAEAKAEGSGAFYDPSTKSVVVISDNNMSVLEAKRNAWHELGHYSFEDLFGQDKSFYNKWIKNKYRQEIEQRLESYGLTPTPELMDNEAGEILIDKFLQGRDNTIRQYVTDQFKKLANKLGFYENEISDVQIRDVVSQMRNNLVYSTKRVATVTEQEPLLAAMQYARNKEGQKGTATGLMLEDDILEIMRKAGGAGNVGAYLNQRGIWKGKVLPQEGINYASNLANSLAKNPERMAQAEKVADIRKKLASGVIDEFSPEYQKAVKELGPAIKGHTIRHRRRFPVGKATIYGPGRITDVREETVKQHPIRGEFKTTIYKDKAGRVITNTPILSTDPKKRAEEIDSIVQKNRAFSDWYRDWNAFMNRFKDQELDQNTINKMIKVQAVLSRKSGPQGNQKMFTDVIDTLVERGELEPERTLKIGTALNMHDLTKINTIWKGEDVASDVDSRKLEYGTKVGAYMAAGLEPDNPEAIVIDRHMPRMWGYNITWTPKEEGERYNLLPNVEQEIASDIRAASQRLNVPASGVQAALWYESRMPDVEASTYSQAAQIKPSAYLPGVLYDRTVPSSLGMGVHYQNTLLKKGEFILATKKDGSIIHSSHSRNDVAIRMAAHTEKNPYAELVYFYEAGTQPEPMLRRKMNRYAVQFDRRRIYDAVNDLLMFWKSARQRVKEDSRAHPTNALSALLKQTGDYDGFVVEAPGGEGRWVLMFDSVAVQDVPVIANIGVSDVIDKAESLPQSAAELAKLMPGRSADFMSRVSRTLKRYPEVTLEHADPAMAQFETETGGKKEISTALKLRGSLSPIRAIASELGIEHAQRMVYVMSTEGKPNGMLFRFKVKPELDTVAKVVDALANMGVTDWNVVVKPFTGNIHIEQFVFDASERMDSSAVRKFVQVREALEDRYFPSNEHFPINSELLGTDSANPDDALADYREQLIDYFGAENGEQRYQAALKRREAYQRAVQRRAVPAAAEGQATEVEEGAAAEGLVEGHPEAVIRRHDQQPSTLDPNNAPLQYSRKAAAEHYKKDLNDLINGKESKYPDLVSLIKDKYHTKIAVSPTLIKRIPDAAAAFFPAKNKIYFAAPHYMTDEQAKKFGFKSSKESTDILLSHEAIHAVIFHELTNPASPSYDKKRHLDFLTELGVFWNSLMPVAIHQQQAGILPPTVANILHQPTVDIRYLEEMVTYGFTHPDFANWLNSIYLEGSTENYNSKTLWQWFKEIVLRAIKPYTYTAMDELHRIMDSYVAMAPKAQQAVLPLQFSRKKLLDQIDPQYHDAVKNIGFYGDQAVNQRANQLNVSIKDKFQINLLDPLSRLAKLEKLQGGTGTSESAYVSFNMLTNFPSILSSMLYDGKLLWRDNWVRLDPNDKNADGTWKGGLYSVIQSLGDDADSFLLRLTAKSAQELLAKDAAAVAAGEPSRFGKGRNLFGVDAAGNQIDDAAEAQDLMDATQTNYNRNRALWDVAESRLRDLNKAMLDIGESAGVINPSTRTEWERANYIPFFRVVSDWNDGEVENLFPHAREHIGKIHRLRGSAKRMGDPLANLVNGYSYLLHQSLRNISRVKAMNVLDSFGLIDRTGPMDRAKNVIDIRVDGKSNYFKVNDRYAFDAIMDMDQLTGGKFSEFFRIPKRLLTWGVTYSPAFRLRNFIRDSIHTSFMAKDFKPWHSLAGAYHAFFNTEWMREYRSTGGAFSGAYHQRDVIQGTEKSIERLKRRLHRRTSRWNPVQLSDLWNRIGEASENAARVGLYMQLRKKGATAMEAGYTAKDLLDFHRSGKSTLLRHLVSTVPFLNARIQGLYRVGRAAGLGRSLGALAGRAAVNFFFRGALLAGIAGLLHLWNEDDPRYKELPDDERYQYWHFFDVPGLGHVRIPIPFEVGMIFGTAPVVFMQRLKHDIDNAALWNYLKFSLVDTFRMDFPQWAKPWIQQMANKDFFTGAPIVPEGQKKTEPQLQYGPRTFEITKEISKVLKSAPIPEEFKSPRRMEKLIQDYFAWAGYTSMALANVGLRFFKHYPEDPAMDNTLGYVTGFSSFVRPEVQHRTKQETDFYKMWQEAETAWYSLNAYKRLGEKDVAKQYREEKIHLLKAYKRMTPVKKKLSQIRLKENEVDADPKLSLEEKKERLDKLALQRNELLRRVMERLEKKRTED